MIVFRKKNNPNSEKVKRLKIRQSSPLGPLLYTKTTLSYFPHVYPQIILYSIHFEATSRRKLYFMNQTS